jgi:hypothetical protein
MRTPAVVREHDRLVGRGDPVLERYARVCFDKAYVPGEVRASVIAPGHPLMDAVVNVTLERHRAELKRGATLIDESDEGRAASAADPGTFDPRRAPRQGRPADDDLAAAAERLPRRARPYGQRRRRPLSRLSVGQSGRSFAAGFFIYIGRATGRTR